MQTYLLTLRYDGTRYAGWQRQAGFTTVQEKIEDALARIFGGHVGIHGAGRTDAGVHALGQAAHVRLPRSFPAVDLPRAINGNLPRDIAVVSVRPVPATFHARFSARGKRYVYRFHVAAIRPVHGTDLFHWVRRPLDVLAMRAAARHLVGEHDFAAFASNPGYQRTRGTVRRVSQVRVVRRPHGIDLAVQGDGFLYNMVRAIAGTLQDVGVGKLRPEQVREILQSRDRSRAGMTAPPGGLFLVRVLYPASALGALDPRGTVWTP